MAGRALRDIQCSYSGKIHVGPAQAANRKRQRQPDDAHGKSDLSILATKHSESRWSEGRDGLRKTGPRQLGLVFADSPFGGGTTEPPDASGRRSVLLYKARHKKTRGPGAGVADTSQLPERWRPKRQSGPGAIGNVVPQQGSTGCGRTDERRSGGCSARQSVMRSAAP